MPPSPDTPFEWSKKAAASDPAPSEDPVAAKTDQVTVLGQPELDYFCKFAREAIASAMGDVKKVEQEIERRLKDKDLKKNLQALKHGAGLGAALFGRMVTGDILARTDAAIHADRPRMKS